MSLTPIVSAFHSVSYLITMIIGEARDIKLSRERQKIGVYDQSDVCICLLAWASTSSSYSLSAFCPKKYAAPKNKIMIAPQPHSVKMPLLKNEPAKNAHQQYIPVSVPFGGNLPFAYKSALAASICMRVRCLLDIFFLSSDILFPCIEITQKKNGDFCKNNRKPKRCSFKSGFKKIRTGS